MLEIEYHKYASNGNNFVLIDEISGEKISEVNKCHFSLHVESNESGIGCDSVLFIQKFDKKTLSNIASQYQSFNYEAEQLPEYIIRIYEKGKESNMCGNGLICVGHHLALKHGITNARIATEIPTYAPVIRQISYNNEGVTSAVLGKATLPSESFLHPSAIASLHDANYCRIKEFPLTINIDGQNHTIFTTDAYITFTGEPHLVFFKQNNNQKLIDAVFNSSESDTMAGKVDTIIYQIGMALNRRLDYFPKGVNVSFSNILPGNTIVTRCFERGINAETYACGTGAVAVASLANELGLLSSDFIHIIPWRARQHALYKDAELAIKKESDKYSMTARSVLLSDGKYYFSKALYNSNPV